MKYRLVGYNDYLFHEDKIIVNVIADNEKEAKNKAKTMCNKENFEIREISEE